MLVGTVKQLENEELDQRVIEAMSTEPITTLGIDGEILDRASAQPAIRMQLDLRSVYLPVRCLSTSSLNSPSALA